MTPPEANRPLEDLDPADWEALRSQAHAMLDDMLTHLETLRDQPVWQPVPAESLDALDQPLPRAPQGLEQAYGDFMQHVLHYGLGDTHPRFFGFVNSPGTVTGALASLAAAVMNSNTGGGSHAANLVERQVLSWCKTITGFPAEASGVLTSGGSMANLLGLSVARHVQARKLGVNIRAAGNQGLPGRLRFYVSGETHSSVQRAIESLGLGSESLVAIPVDAAYAMDVQALQSAITGDREAGLFPACVVGTAGTTNTGSIDPLNAIADICQREGLWFHCDGAIGAVASLAPSLRPLLKGMERADSLAFDMHKWLFVNYTVGCVLIRSEADHRDTFTLTPPYLKHAEHGPISGDPWFSDYSVELSRESRGLKVWMMLKDYGADHFARQVEQGVHLADYLAERIASQSELELLAPHPLHIINFRYRGGAPADRLNALNAAIALAVQESGAAMVTTTTIRGSTSIRACINNHRTRYDDIDLMLDAVLTNGRALELDILR